MALDTHIPLGRPIKETFDGKTDEADYQHDNQSLSYTSYGKCEHVKMSKMQGEIDLLLDLPLCFYPLGNVWSRFTWHIPFANGHTDANDGFRKKFDIRGIVCKSTI